MTARTRPGVVEAMQSLRAAAIAAVIALSTPVWATPTTPSSAPALRAGLGGRHSQGGARPGARAVLVNVWATWCIPCREELPDLLRLRRDYAARGLRVILVSGDFASDAEQAAGFPRPARRRLPDLPEAGHRHGVHRRLRPQWSGALPATFIYDAAGHQKGTIHGIATYAQLEEHVRDVLNSQ